MICKNVIFCNLFSIISQPLIFTIFLQRLIKRGQFYYFSNDFLTSSEINNFMYLLNHQIINLFATHGSRLNVGDSEATRRQIISNISL